MLFIPEALDTHTALVWGLANVAPEERTGKFATMLMIRATERRGDSSVYQMAVGCVATKTNLLVIEDEKEKQHQRRRQLRVTTLVEPAEYAPEQRSFIPASNTIETDILPISDAHNVFIGCRAITDSIWDIIEDRPVERQVGFMQLIDEIEDITHQLPPGYQLV